MIEPLAIALDKPGFEKYVKGDLPARMRLWRPRGIVLHNTGNPPSLRGFYFKDKAQTKPLPGPQRVKNIWESYRAQKWQGGPHLFVTDIEIILANPLWKPGTHSPSWNSTMWGLETPGDMDVDLLTDKQRDMIVHTCAVLFAALGHEPDDNTLKLHKEDPRTTHKRCPGKNFGTKQEWIDMIRDRMAQLAPGGCQCGAHVA